MRLTLVLGALTAIVLPASVQAQSATADPAASAATQQADPAQDTASAGTAGTAAPATASDVVAHASVYDQSGGTVGTIESVDASGAVLSTGSVKVRVPVTSFAKTDKGLVIGMTKAEVEAAAKKAG